MAIIAYSLFLMGTLSLGADFWAVLWPRFVQGFGMGLVFVPLTTMALTAVSAGGAADRERALQRRAERRAEAWGWR